MEEQASVSACQTLVTGTTNLSFDKVNDTKVTNEGLYIPLYIYLIVSIANTLIFIVGTIGNIMVIVIVTKVREMRTPTNLFLLNLSAADVLVLLVCQPAALLEFFGKDRWFLGEFMCKCLHLLQILCSYMYLESNTPCLTSNF